MPLRVGGGTRLKVLEAMAAGTPVVSTTLGAEGLAVTHGKDILIADTPEAMADAVVSCRPDSPQWQELVANARQLVQAKYDWNVVGEILLRLHAEQVEMGAACLESERRDQACRRRSTFREDDRAGSSPWSVLLVVCAADWRGALSALSRRSPSW